MKLENRCNEYVKDKETRRQRKCSKCYYRILNNKKMCWIHYNKQYNKYILFIQKIYRGYRCRKVIKNIFIKLPIDIQYKIINYNRTDYYYKKYCNLIYRLIHKRYIITLTTNNLNILHYNLLVNSDSEFINNFDNINNTYYLYDKYFDIIYNKSTNYKKYNYIFDMIRAIDYLHLYSDNLIKKLKNISQNYFYEISDNSQNNIEYLKNTYTRLNNCIKYVTSFKNKYIEYNN